jgi:hypothetical protein
MTRIQIRVRECVGQVFNLPSNAAGWNTYPTTFAAESWDGGRKADRGPLPRLHRAFFKSAIKEATR